MPVPEAPPVDTAICPYCGAPTEIRDASVVYGPCDFGRLLICTAFPKCDSFVGIHRNTDTPKGTLANAGLRGWRKRAHAAFDPLWRSGRMSRGQAYRRLSDILGIPPAQTHIAWLTAEQCAQVISSLTAKDTQ